MKALEAGVRCRYIRGFMSPLPWDAPEDQSKLRLTSYVIMSENMPASKNAGLARFAVRRIFSRWPLWSLAADAVHPIYSAPIVGKRRSS